MASGTWVWVVIGLLVIGMVAGLVAGDDDQGRYWEEPE